ncbi:unnamed protein product [Pseudo-nitzschia multistriata]|uniref:Uncharacterized protein n=1 Tax=Pseudo-nitzschia multistriata TaxID=183589 RepID=A0A448YY87_9STRA|nr:unnamed protein product [Pseudo-nitzschia multistriata]
MCIAFFVWTEHRFLVCHNRDEYFSRPTTGTEWWPNESTSGNDRQSFRILAPRDGVSGGTWFGYEQTTGRCAFLTNIDGATDSGSTKRTHASSRGEIVVNYLRSDPSCSALDYLRREFGCGDGADVAVTGNTGCGYYAGFNLVVFSGRDLAYVSNRGGGIGISIGNTNHRTGPVALEQGRHYGLSNSLLHQPLPKVREGLELFRTAVHRSNSVYRDSYIGINTGEQPRCRHKIDDPDDNKDDENRLFQELKELMRHAGPSHRPEGVAHNSSLLLSDASSEGERTPGEKRLERRRSSICVPIDDTEYGTRTTIRFLLQTNQQEPRLLRWTEQHRNPDTLDWEGCLEFGCESSL